MASLIGSKSMPPGIRFHPTDEELFMFYLKRKVLGKSLRPEMISEIDVYRFAPWDLPSQSCLKTRDLNWYFFCPRSKRYPHGGRFNRSTEHGYWKATGNDRTVKYDHRPVGKIKTLIFHIGKAPQGERTDWVMHEYRLEDKVLGEKGVPHDAYVICKVYKKSGLGPKNGENYGAHFVEEEWESDDDNKVEKVENQRDSTRVTGPTSVVDTPNAPAITSSLHVDNAAASTPCSQQPSSVSSACNGDEMAVYGTEPPADLEAGEDELDRMLAMFTEDNEAPNNSPEDIFGGLEDLCECWSSKVGSNWSQFVDGNEYFIELDDLN